MSRPDATPDVNALAFRLMSFVLLAGAAITVAMAFAMTRLPQVARQGATLYILPGTGGRRLIDPTAVTVLGGAGIVMLVLGVLGVVFARRPARGKPRQLSPSAARLDVHRRRRALATLVVGVALLASVLGLRWTRTAHPPAPPTSLIVAPHP